MSPLGVRAEHSYWRLQCERTGSKAQKPTLSMKGEASSGGARSTASVKRDARSTPAEGEGATGDGCSGSPRGSEVVEEVVVEGMASLERSCGRSAMVRDGTLS